LGLLVRAVPPTDRAQETSVGEREFINSCAQCHGADGKGQGVLASHLVGSLPDLTQLQARNGGRDPRHPRDCEPVSSP
jgi:mono/diheme cytochrome c family protein